jgi:hypothetical protein
MIQIILGLILALFLPGYLIARTFFKELSELEKVALAFVLSISIDIFLGLFLGYNETMKNITGGITAQNLWIYLPLITVILFSIYVYKNPKEIPLLISSLTRYAKSKKVSTSMKPGNKSHSPSKIHDQKPTIHKKFLTSYKFQKYQFIKITIHSLIIVSSLLLLIYKPESIPIYCQAIPIILILWTTYVLANEKPIFKKKKED